MKRFMEGLEVSEETLALDIVDEVGPHGDFLGTKHTVEHFKEDWYPNLLDRNNFEGWAAEGGNTLRQRARARVNEIVAGSS